MTDPTKPAAPPIAGISHLTFPVADLAIAEAFYVTLLGATLLRRVDRATFLRSRPERAAEADADNSPLHLELRFGAGPEVHLFLQRGRARQTPPTHPHLALDVGRDDLLVFQARLHEAGVTTDGPRRLGPPGHASVYFADPFGNTLELVTGGFEGPVREGPPNMAALAYEWAQ
jgi:catechol 2,3-dioxygenase-like lactoylglutathione lyase family enzyme